MSTIKKEKFFAAGCAGAILGLYAASAFLYFSNAEASNIKMPEENQQLASFADEAYLAEIKENVFSPLGSDSLLTPRIRCEGIDQNFWENKEWQESNNKTYKLY